MDVSEASALVELAEEVDGHVLDADAAEWTRRLDARAGGLAEAADVLLEAGEHRAALRLVGALSRYAQESGRIDDVRALAEHVLSEVAPASDPAEQARAHLTLGELAFRQGDQAAATVATEAAVDDAERAGDLTTAARAEMNLSRVAFRDGDAPRIAHHAERILELAPDDPRLRSAAIHMLGWAAYTAGDMTTAMERFRENVERYRAAGNVVNEASELANLGDLSVEASDLDAAADYLRQAMDVAASIRSLYLLPGLLASAATLAGARHRDEESVELTAAARRQYELAGLTPDPGGELAEELRARARRGVADDRARELEIRGASRSLDEAIELARAVLR